ncbi:hypothetical protein [Kolteria novifilia]
MLTDFNGQVLLEPREVAHTRGDLAAAASLLRDPRVQRRLGDLLVAIERTGDYHLPVLRAFRNEGFETRLVSAAHRIRGLERLKRRRCTHLRRTLAPTTGRAVFPETLRTPRPIESTWLVGLGHLLGTPCTSNLRNGSHRAGSSFHPGAVQFEVLS